MCFYGLVRLALGIYLICCILWSVGGGFNEFDRTNERIRIFRWGYPGANRRIELVYPWKEVEAVRVELQEGWNPRRRIYLRLKGNRTLLLTRIGQPLTLEELERQAAELARFLQVSLEGLALFRASTGSYALGSSPLSFCFYKETNEKALCFCFPFRNEIDRPGGFRPSRRALAARPFLAGPFVRVRCGIP